VKGLSDALSVEHPVVFGSSFGGFVARKYAASYPDHPSGLILASTCPRMLDEEALIERFREVGARRGAHAAWSEGTFEPQIVRKGQRRFEGFDDKILVLYSRGLSTRDIEAHLADIYGVKVGRDLISRVTDAVMEGVREWQQPPLDDFYPVLFLDALVLKIREGGTVRSASSAGSLTPASSASSVARAEAE
jgi:pimeloyl-ACP methyl ester carboxylesterase